MMRVHPVWHPCTQMKDHEAFPLVEVVGAKGSYIHLSDGRKLIDAISSWWCKSLGHQHPRIRQAIINQLNQFEHVILAGTTNNFIETFAEKLTQQTKTLNKVFFASDGSSAVEIAIKMSLHARKIMGEEGRKQFLTLENSYHGETIGTLSVSDTGLYQAPYKDLMFSSSVITGVPYVNGRDDPLWFDCTQAWGAIEKQLNPYKKTATAILVEPILQGAGGMRIYSQDFLKKLRAWTKENDVHLIADEIATGFGRTGKMFASQHADIEPDFMCLGKGLTAGFIPMAVTLTTQAIYDLFYDDYHTGKAFLHSHTHSGNALAVAAGLEVLRIYEEENIFEKVNVLGDQMFLAMKSIADATNALTNVRRIGAVVAADLSIANAPPRLGYAVHKKALALGALIRPLGNTLYWFPPLNTDESVIAALESITAQAVKAVMI